MSFHFTIEKAIANLEAEAGRVLTTLLKNGTMKVEYYRPTETDWQKPHVQDEIYVIASGTSTFIREGKKIYCKQTDLLFVPAGADHRFLDFSDDFATWVMFYGKKEEEKD
jgi:mannose-6-phosphate isomerase-like protein (cupin superfamily)